MKLLQTLLVTCVLAAPVLPCSAFLVVGDGRILFGNNEDFWDPKTQIWFVPAAGERRGVMYLGYTNGFPQGAMNDAGLAFDGFATGNFAMTKQEGKAAFPGNPINEVMETCTTVAEAIAFLENVDLRPILTQAMLFFADASGDSVIIEGDEFLRKQGDYQAITNFYQSAQDDDLAQCPRYAAAVGVLEAREQTSIALCETALSAAAQRGSRVATLYSNVFDLKARTMSLYLFHDFENPVVMNLDEELKHGARVLSLPELFPTNPAFEEYVKRQAQTVAERIAERAGPTLSDAQLEQYATAFELTAGGKQYPVTIRREGDGLIATSTAFQSPNGEVQLHSSSPTEFFALAESGEMTVTFHIDKQSEVTGFTLEASGVDYEATRTSSD